MNLEKINNILSNNSIPSDFTLILSTRGNRNNPTFRSFDRCNRNNKKERVGIKEVTINFVRVQGEEEVEERSKSQQYQEC